MSAVKLDKLGIIVLNNFKHRGAKVDAYLREFFKAPKDKSFILPVEAPRFANGEAKVKILESVRGKDIYIISDIGDYSCTYKIFGYENHMSPDDHFQDIKRVLSAVAGKARRITVIMPLLYSSRQHRRAGRESLDCAMALQELEALGINSVITFDAHDPNIQNAIPNSSFDSVFPMYNILKAFIEKEQAIINNENTVIISPDVGAMNRAVSYASILGLNVGMFYKRRDYSRIIDGKNPIIAHEYSGQDLTGKNAIIVDDMIASGDSVIDIVNQLKERGAKDVYAISTFAFFTHGLEKFDELYKKGLIKKVYSTNASYLPKKLLAREWFCSVDLTKTMARMIHALSHDESISPFINPTQKFNQLLSTYGKVLKRKTAKLSAAK